MPDDTYPRSEGLYLTDLTDGYELHRAAAEVSRLMNASVGLSPEQQSLRKNLLKTSYALIIAERNKRLDDFCAAWIKYRTNHNGGDETAKT